MGRAQSLEREFPQRSYGNLVEAIDTNDITRYFPGLKTAGGTDPTRAVLNRLQQDAAGKIKWTSVASGANYVEGDEQYAQDRGQNYAGLTVSALDSGTLYIELL